MIVVILRSGMLDSVRNRKRKRKSHGELRVI